KDVSSTIFDGNKLGGVPEHSGRFWANYKFSDYALKGFSIGTGIYAQSETMVDGVNKYEVPGYHTYDAKIAYIYKNYEASLAIKNLTNRDYYERYDYYGGRVAPGMERTYLANLNVRF
ncbi:TonB-dependent receptor, partial [Aliarcobacter butzleri]